MKKIIFIIISIFFFNINTNAYYNSEDIPGYYDESDNYDNINYDDRDDDRDYYDDNENYDNDFYDYNTNDAKLNYCLTGCNYNGICYSKPTNAHCAFLDKYNAWICNSGYYEKGNKCIKEKSSNTICNIKGNISYNNKTKVYYLPECGKYNEVKIDEKYGEKWFCSEEEAINAGWIKSYRCSNSNNTNTFKNINGIEQLFSLIQLIIIFIIYIIQGRFSDFVDVLQSIFIGLIFYIFLSICNSIIITMFNGITLFIIILLWTTFLIWKLCFSDNEKI